MIRTYKFEVGSVSGDWKETRARWQSLSDQCREATNCIWVTWLMEMERNGTREKVRKWLAEFKEWVKTKEGKKPKYEGFAVDSKVQKVIYDRLAKEVPELNTTTRELVRNEICGLIGAKKSAEGNLPGWMSILLYRESLPSTTKGQPIPFNVKNGKLLPPATSADNWQLELRLDRIPREGKSATSTVDTVQLITKKKGIAGHAEMLWKCLRGEAKYKGSSLYYCRKNNKWFALICVEEAIADVVTGDKAAILTPGRQYPWTLWIDGRPIPIGGNGKFIGVQHANIKGQRRSRQNNYRFAAMAAKGHGTGRALQGIADSRLTRAWNDLCRSYNHQVTRAVARICQENGVGKILYLQPAGAKNGSRFLSTVGREQWELDKGMGAWPWFQVGEMLNYKMKEHGIHVEVQKCDADGKRKASPDAPVPVVRKPGPSNPKTFSKRQAKVVR